METELLLTVTEAAGMLCVNPMTVHRWIHSGRLPGVVRVGARFRIPYQAVAGMVQPAARTGQAEHSDGDVGSEGIVGTQKPTDDAEPSSEDIPAEPGCIASVGPVVRGESRLCAVNYGKDDTDVK